MEGGWRHGRKGKRLDLTIEPFGRKPARWVCAAAEAEAERLASFVGGSLALSWVS